MVSNKNIVLDAGQKKYVPECIYMKYEQWFLDFLKKVDDMNYTFESYHMFRETAFSRNMYGGNVIHGNEQQVLEKQRNFINQINKLENDDFLIQYKYCLAKDIKPSKSIADYMGVIPFSPSVMINISPHWKSEKCPKSWMEIKKNALKYALEKYLNDCNRYDNWEAVIECGGEGNFVHAHAVAHVNPQMLKSVLGAGRPKGARNTSHIGKGSGVNACLQKHINKYFFEYFKDKRALEKAFNAHLKCDKGYRGLLGGKFAVQICILRNEVLVKDKQDYLIEEKKPEGHKNMDVEGFPLYFTSKVITENVERNPFEG